MFDVRDGRPRFGQIAPTRADARDEHQSVSSGVSTRSRPIASVVRSRRLGQRRDYHPLGRGRQASLPGYVGRSCAPPAPPAGVTVRGARGAIIACDRAESSRRRSASSRRTRTRSAPSITRPRSPPLALHAKATGAARAPRSRSSLTAVRAPSIRRPGCSSSPSMRTRSMRDTPRASGTALAAYLVSYADPRSHGSSSWRSRKGNSGPSSASAR